MSRSIISFFSTLFALAISFPLGILATDGSIRGIETKFNPHFKQPTISHGDRKLGTVESKNLQLCVYPKEDTTAQHYFWMTILDSDSTIVGSCLNGIPSGVEAGTSRCCRASNPEGGYNIEVDKNGYIDITDPWASSNEGCGMYFGTNTTNDSLCSSYNEGGNTLCFEQVKAYDNDSGDEYSDATKWVVEDSDADKCGLKDKNGDKCAGEHEHKHVCVGYEYCFQSRMTVKKNQGDSDCSPCANGYVCECDGLCE